MYLLFGWMSRPDPAEERLSQLLAVRNEARTARDNAFNGMKSARIEVSGVGETIDDLRKELDETDRAMREALLSGR